MQNAMTRLKQQFKDIRFLLGVQYNVFELNGKDEQYSSNDRGYTKKVMSDFLRVFNSIDKTYSFSFAFNNPEREDCGGVIVSAQVNKNHPQLRAYFKFENFKNAINSLVKEMKLATNSNHSLDYPKMHELVVKNFNLKIETLNLDSFVEQLINNLKQTEAEYEAVAKTIDTLTSKIQKEKNNKNKEDFKLYTKEMREVINGSKDQISRIIDFYIKMIHINKEALLLEQPYISYRLLGHIVAPKLNEAKVLDDLKPILLKELDAQPGYSSWVEQWSD